jgi:DNA-binding MarR family transcriptional regulator
MLAMQSCRPPAGSNRKPAFVLFVKEVSYHAGMRPVLADSVRLRQYRNTRLYRPLSRILRVYNRRLVEGLHARGFTDFSPGFPPLLSNLDVEGTRIGVLASRAGVTRQAAGQLLREIEKCDYIERRAAADDARATVVRFTARGRRLLATVFELVDQIEAEFADLLADAAFDDLRDMLVRLADRVDPIGAFGFPDEQPKRAPRRKRRRRRDADK